MGYTSAMVAATVYGWLTFVVNTLQVVQISYSEELDGRLIHQNYCWLQIESDARLGHNQG